MQVTDNPTGAEIAPSTESPGVQRANAAARGREYLLPGEVDAMVRAARSAGRHGPRDAALILLGYRHGFRVSELCALEWRHVDLRAATLAVTRRKAGSPATHPLAGVEVRALRAISRDTVLPWVFVTERGSKMHPNTAYDVIVRAGVLAGLPFPVHPHMLRHACGFTLANRGHDMRLIAGYLGHRNLQSTMRYTELSPHRFKDFWRNDD